MVPTLGQKQINEFPILFEKFWLNDISSKLGLKKEIDTDYTLIKNLFTLHSVRFNVNIDSKFMGTR